MKWHRHDEVGVRQSIDRAEKRADEWLSQVTSALVLQAVDRLADIAFEEEGRRHRVELWRISPAPGADRHSDERRGAAPTAGARNSRQCALAGGAKPSAAAATAETSWREEEVDRALHEHLAECSRYDCARRRRGASTAR